VDPSSIHINSFHKNRQRIVLKKYNLIYPVTFDLLTRNLISISNSFLIKTIV
jgi:hypothetical protein